MSTFDLNNKVAANSRLLGKIKCLIEAQAGGTSGGGACPPVPPTVNCTTVKCCDPTDECKSVFVTTCYTTPITVITVPGEPGSGDTVKNTPCCGGGIPFEAPGSVPFTCEYEVGETTETTKIAYADGTLYTGDPTVLDPTCNCQPTYEYIQKEACFGEMCEKGCILIKIDTGTDTVVSTINLDSAGNVTTEPIVPCPTFEIISTETCSNG